MEKWKRDILKNNIAEDVVADYRELLSVGKQDEEAEDIIVCFYTQNASFCKDEKENFWIALALIQWEWGRLSTKVKETAIAYLDQADKKYPQEKANLLKQCLHSAMPPKKRISRPKGISKCPWPVGSLLAYRIMSTDFPKVVGGPYWHKYILLRVIMIERTPIARLSPESEWRESMIVGLYDWYGDSIPNPTIAEHLSFTPIEVQKPFLSENMRSSLSQKLEQNVNADIASSLKERLLSPRIETCTRLDWHCAKGIDPKEVFTYLGHDSKYEEGVLDFFKTEITQCSISHSIPFDVTLANRFEQLAKDKR